MKLIFTTYKNLEKYLTSVPQDTEPIADSKHTYTNKKQASKDVDGKGENSIDDGKMSNKGRYNEIKGCTKATSSIYMYM